MSHISNVLSHQQTHSPVIFFPPCSKRDLNQPIEIDKLKKDNMKLERENEGGKAWPGTLADLSLSPQGKRPDFWGSPRLDPHLCCELV